MNQHSVTNALTLAILPCYITHPQLLRHINFILPASLHGDGRLRYTLPWAGRDCFPSELTVSGAERTFAEGIVLCFLKPREASLLRLREWNYTNNVLERLRFHANERDNELSGHRLHEY